MLKDGLISYWKFDEGSGNAISSIGGTTLSNNNVTYTTGKINNGATFNGSSAYFTTTSIDPDNYNSGLSYSIWYKPASFASAQQLFMYGDTSWSGVDIGINSSTSLRFRFGNGVSGDGGTATFTVSEMLVGTWYHFVMTHSATTNTFYMNGSSLGTDTSNVTLSGSTTSLTVGRVDGAGINYTNGMLDEFGIWTRELSSDEVTALYNSGNGLPLESFYYNTYGEYLGAGPTNTKLLLHLNGSSADSSGNGNNGTDTNITYVDGKFGKCASFNGSSSKITIATGLSLSTMTTSLWFNSTTNNTGSMICFPNSTGDTGVQNVIWLNAVTSSGKIRYGGGSTIESSDSYKDGLWHNVIVSVSGTSGNLYIDGKLVASGTVDNLNFTCYPRIGTQASAGGNTNWFTGLIDEKIVEPRAWSAEEIKRYYTYSKGRFGII